MRTIRPTNDGPRASALSVEYLPPQAVKPYPNNARAHSKRQLTKFAASIAEFGFVVPVLIDGGNSLIAGHARVEAATRNYLKNRFFEVLVTARNSRLRPLFSSIARLWLNFGAAFSVQEYRSAQFLILLHPRNWQTL
jgi:ParB-like nuclease domain